MTNNYTVMYTQAQSDAFIKAANDDAEVLGYLNNSLIDAYPDHPAVSTMTMAYLADEDGTIGLHYVSAVELPGWLPKRFAVPSHRHTCKVYIPGPDSQLARITSLQDWREALDRYKPPFFKLLDDIDLHNQLAYTALRGGYSVIDWSQSEVILRTTHPVQHPKLINTALVTYTVQ